jgi:hypothetical protein
MHKKGKMISRSVVDHIAPNDKQYLALNPIGAPLLGMPAVDSLFFYLRLVCNHFFVFFSYSADSHTNELYLWHGNTHQFIAGLTSKRHEIGIALRTAVLSGAGGTKRVVIQSHFQFQLLLLLLL